MRKANLVPVCTRPSVNNMLGTYSREVSAQQSNRSKSGNGARIPRIGKLTELVYQFSLIQKWFSKALQKSAESFIDLLLS